MPNNELTKNENRVINDVLTGNSSAVGKNDMSALIGGIIHAASEVSVATLNAVCEDRRLRAEMIAQMQSSVQSLINTESESIKQLLNSNEANIQMIRDMITGTEISDERLKWCFEELRYYAGQNQRIVTEQQQHDEKLLEKANAMQKDLVEKDSIIIPKAAVAQGVKAFVETPITRQLIGQLVGKLIIKLLS